MTQFMLLGIAVIILAIYVVSLAARLKLTEKRLRMVAESLMVTRDVVCAQLEREEARYKEPYRVDDSR